MIEQKFHTGDHVRVNDDRDYGDEAIVIGSYRDQYGGSATDSYTLHFKRSGRVSWFYEKTLELIATDRTDLLRQWQAEQEAEIAEKSSLDWIFDHGPEVAEKPNGASLQALATSKGLGSLWGANGEGITYYTRSMQVLEWARPFLLSKDKAGWMALNFTKPS